MGLGVLLGLMGSVLINVGNNVQALGMGLVEEQKHQWELSGLTPSKPASTVRRPPHSPPTLCRAP